jgi:hypothetical protein
MLVSNLLCCQSERTKIGSSYDLWAEDCSLVLLDSGEYLFYFFAHVAIDIVFEDVLSCGKYEKKGNVITLTDVQYKFDMVVHILDDDSLWFEKSFEFLNNKKFLYFKRPYYNTHDKVSLYFEHDYSKIDPPTLSSIKEVTPFSMYDIIFFNSNGIYRNVCYSLDLNENQTNQTYKLFFSNSLISEGTWERFDNILSFHDKCLNYTFYLTIKGNMLKSIEIPGYDNQMLKMRYVIGWYE